MLTYDRTEVSAHLATLPGLSQIDGQGIMWVLAQCPHLEASAATTSTSNSFPESAWASSGTLSGISMSKQLPIAPERVYKMRGVGHIAASSEIIYEMIVRLDLMRLWDPLQRSGSLLTWDCDAGDGMEQGLAHTVYGIPGASVVFHNRDLLTRIVTVRLPSGVVVLYAKSCQDGVPLDPGPAKRTVRGQMGASGWVLVPEAEGSTGVTVILQVDPKGSVPAFIANAAGIAIPMHIHRLAKVLKSMSPERVKQIISERQRGTCRLSQSCSDPDAQTSQISAQQADASGNPGTGSGKMISEDGHTIVCTASSSHLAGENPSCKLDLQAKAYRSIS